MNKFIILFDGQCNLCSKTVRFVKKREVNNKFSFLSLQSDAGKNILKDFGLNINDSNSITFIKGNQVYQKSSAVLKILELMNSPWKYLVVFRFLPKGIRDFFYDIVSKNRYRILGKNTDNEKYC